MSAGRDDGYAIVAAVATLAVFAAIAYAVLAGDRGEIADLRAQYARARLEAAADAGLAKAIAALAVDDPAQRWPIDGRSQAISFEGVNLSIVIEDEQGKVPMSGLTEEQVRRLFSGAGVAGERLETLVHAYLNWTSDDAEPEGSDVDQYLARGVRPRNGAPLTVDELASLKGMDSATLARIRPALTAYFGDSQPFSKRTAKPLAIAVLSEAGEDSPEVLEQQKVMEGERTAEDIEPDKSLAGRAVTVVVDARDAQGDGLERRTVVELTGKASPAYYIRQQD